MLATGTKSEESARPVLALLYRLTEGKFKQDADEHFGIMFSHARSVYPTDGVSEGTAVGGAVLVQHAAQAGP